MAKNFSKWLVGLVIAGTVFPSAADAAGLSLRTIAAQERRVATIGYRIASMNAAYCDDPQIMSGLIVHELGQYPSTARAAVSTSFSLRNGIGVLEIVPGSGAERAGLRVDDEIISVGGYSVEDANVRSSRSPSYARIENFLATLSQRLTYGPQDVLVRRQGQLLRLSLSGQPGCGGAMKFVDSSNVNAWSDGRHVVISDALIRMTANDDQLAFVIAHEMAHNILKHSAGKAEKTRSLFGRLLQTGGALGSESQADAAAVSLMARAGYVPEAAVAFLRNASRRMWWSFSLTHPTFGRRIRNVASAVKGDSFVPHHLGTAPSSLSAKQTILLASRSKPVPDRRSGAL